MKLNLVTSFAHEDGRSYITPEDVQKLVDEAYDLYGELPDKTKLNWALAELRKDVLEVLGNQAGFGAEDSGLCAFVAWKGESSNA
jgi:hypothetical protein